ncbi:DUF1349 domain-containing protein [Flavobacterium sp. HBTb2-11-1]|uniref:DUF1349 domain-containing protein n=1 Tax=Flavobacterium sp. HBTb2-11-1 TaxID=2692212 RepID=UPI00136E8588|nr:DUF1349 domain-containing protein [Flavobacterium sp. HBTb2-11-1]MXO04669.1 DUF1349 domain-containing protein [Flavobacterium sp. HBTb2-11-1]
MKTFFPNILIILSLSILLSCNNKNKSAKATLKEETKTDSAFVNGSPCDIKLSSIHFTKAVNGADSLIKLETNEKIIFKAGEKSDYFSDPNEKLSNTSAPMLLSKVDNTKPFTLTAKVTPEFTEKGLYNAGVLYLYVNDSFYQKFCFEQDERGNHRVVTVRTMRTSDDNNHDVVKVPSVYMKISSDTKTVASYYSVDKKNWQMVRLYKNNYPKEIWVGISTQCPVDKGTKSIFEEINLEEKSVSDFRLGI